MKLQVTIVTIIHYLNDHMSLTSVELITTKGYRMDNNLKALYFISVVSGHHISEIMLSDASCHRKKSFLPFFSCSEYLIMYYYLCNLEVVIH